MNQFADLIPKQSTFDDLVPQQGRLSNAGNKFVHGASNVTSMAMKGAIIPRLKFNTDVNSLFDVIDQGNLPSRWDYFLSNYEGGDKRLSKNRPEYGLLQEYENADEQTRAQLRSKFSANPDNQYLVRKGNELKQYTNEEFPTNKAYEGEFFADLLPQGAGSTAAFTLVGGLTRGAGLNPLSGAALTGSMTNSASQFEDALAHQASFEDAYKAADLGAVIGTTEGIPIAKLFDRYDTMTGGSIKKIIKKGIKGGAEEGIQELAQSIGDMLIASKLVKYDPDRGFEGVGESAGVGFTVGTLYSTIAAMMGSKLRGRKAEGNPNETTNENQEASEQPFNPAAPSGNNGFTPVSGTTSGILSDTASISADNVFMDLVPGKAPSVNSDQNQFNDLIPSGVSYQLDNMSHMVPGKNYSGLIDQQGGPSVPATINEQNKKPLIRQNIISDFLKDVGRTVFTGHIPSQRKALGFFRPKNQEVRVKKTGDIEVTAHEIAHYIDFDVPAIREAYRKSPIFNEELKSVSYDKNNVKEGFAEFVRLWTTQKGHAKESAPQFYSWFESFVQNDQRYGPALIKAQQNMSAWFHQSALDRARSKVGEFEASAVQTVGSRFRQAVIDDLSGIEAVEKKLSGDVVAGGIYETARLSRGASGILQGAVQYGAPKLIGGRRVFVDLKGEPSVVQTNANGKKILAENPRYQGGGLETILEPVSNNLEEFGLYAIGRRASFLKSQGRENLFTQNEIDAMASLETPERRKTFADWNRFNHQILDFAQESGIINPQGREQWQTDVYLPFWRIDKNATKGSGEGGVIHKLTGGTSNLRDPIANMFQNTKMLIEASIVNKAKLDVIKGIAKADNGGHFIAKVPKTNKAVHIDREQVKKEFFDVMGAVDSKTAQELETQFESLEPFIRFWLHGQAPKGDDIVSFMENGKTEYYQVADPLLYRSITSMPRLMDQNFVVQWLKNIKNISQMTITLSADFMLRNILRDTVMASVLSKNGFVPFVDAARGFKHRVANDPVYQEWLASGGAISGFFHDEGDFTRKLETFYKSRGVPYNLIINTPKKMLSAVNNIADSFETATRLSEFRRSMERGASQSHAGFESRDISSDFAMRGDSKTLGFMYDTVMFLKAGVVGMDRVYRGLAKDTNRGQVALKTGMLALASMGLYALNRDNPLYEELEDWEKDNHWHFFVPTEEYYRAKELGLNIPPHKLYTHYRFPKPWEIGGIGTIAERSLGGVLDNDPSQGFAILNVIREMFRYEFMPQAIKPLYEQATNNISFINRPIETPSMQNVEPFARSAPSGSRLLRDVGESTRKWHRELQFNPARAEALLRGYFNTWALYGLTLADAALYDEAPDITTNQIPGLRSIYKDGPGNTRYRTEFYEMLKEATEARATMRLMDRTNRQHIGDEFADSPANLEYKRMMTANKYLQTINAEMKLVVNAQSLDETRQLANTMFRNQNFKKDIVNLRQTRAWNNMGALKRELLDIWGYERNRFVKEVVTDSE